MMLHCRKSVQFIFIMTIIKNIDKLPLSSGTSYSRDAWDTIASHAWCMVENVLGLQLC